MHKKSVENSHTPPGKPSSTTPTPTQEKPADEAIEEEQDKQRKDTNSLISKEELRENSIAALRAKAQEHSAKMLNTVSNRTKGPVTHKEEAGDQEMEQDTAEEKRNWKRPEETDWWWNTCRLESFNTSQRQRLRLTVHFSLTAHRNICTTTQNCTKQFHVTVSD